MLRVFKAGDGLEIIQIQIAVFGDNTNHGVNRGERKIFAQDSEKSNLKS
jgi:hypothetical protein